MEFTTDTADAASVIDLLGRAGEAALTHDFRAGSCVRLPRRGRLLATGDLHDNLEHLARIIRLAGLEKGEDRHVIFHELIHGDRLINGMDFSYRMLCRAAELSLRFPGQVHTLLANHELAQMTGRSVSKGAGDNVQQFDEALDYVFGDEAGEVAGAIASFLRALPLALISESGVMCSHSLPSPAALDIFDFSIFERDLTEADYEPMRGSAYLTVWGRGHTADFLDDLGRRLGVRLFCIGHTHVETGREPLGRNAIILNSDHEHAAVLPIDLTVEPDRDELLWHVLPLASFA